MPKFDGHGHICGMGVGTPATLMQTIAGLLAAKVPLERFLPAFTRNVADLLRWPHKGRIEVGAAADLLALTPSGRLSAVLAHGSWLVRDGQPVVWGRFERSSA
jgi:beta-aspartyl-dipeptidase (metallo-type)